MIDNQKYIIQRDVHFVRYDRWGNETEYPDGYEIQGKWELRVITDDRGNSEFVECCVSLKEAKYGLNLENVTIDKTKYGEPSPTDYGDKFEKSNPLVQSELDEWMDSISKGFSE